MRSFNLINLIWTMNSTIIRSRSNISMRSVGPRSGVHGRDQVAAVLFHKSVFIESMIEMVDQS